MAARKVMEVFQQELRRTNLSKESPVAIGLSGGSDSMALLWLAKQLFTNVIGLTVDHRLRETSTDEAAKTAELAVGMGAKHHMLTVDWEGNAPAWHYKYQTAAREKRYDAMLDYCQTASLGMLMTAHHRDDQIETMVYRMCKGSSIDGMAGMYVLSQRIAYPRVKILRPLLQCDKKDLTAVCQEAGLEWVEDSSNSFPYFSRNYIRQVLDKDPTLVQGLRHMHSALAHTRGRLTSTVGTLVRKLTVVHAKYGYVTVDKAALLELPKPVLWRVFSALLKYVSSDIRPVGYKQLDHLVSNISSEKKVFSLHHCCVFPLPKKGAVGLCSATNGYHRPPHPISIGQPLIWDNRWEIHLFSAPGSDQGDRQYFVRHFHMDDGVLARRGIRAVRSAVLPPVLTRLALPVIVDQDGTVALIPHFKYTNRTFALSANVQYKPQLTLDCVVNQHENVYFN